MKLLHLILCSIIFLASSSCTMAQEMHTSNQTALALADHGIQLPQSTTFAVVQTSRTHARGITFSILNLKSEHVRIELEILHPITAKEAPEYKKMKYAIINNLYSPKLIPYGGALTHNTGCPEKMMPVPFTATVLDQDSHVLITTASERYALGVWEEKLAVNRAAFSVVYDESLQRLFYITIFMKTASFSQNKVKAVLEGIKKLP